MQTKLDTNIHNKKTNTEHLSNVTEQPQQKLTDSLTNNCQTVIQRPNIFPTSLPLQRISTETAAMQSESRTVPCCHSRSTSFRHLLFWGERMLVCLGEGFYSFHVVWVNVSSNVLVKLTLLFRVRCLFEGRTFSLSSLFFCSQVTLGDLFMGDVCWLFDCMFIVWGTASLDCKVLVQHHSLLFRNLEFGS